MTSSRAYHTALEALKKTRDALALEDVLLIPVNTVIHNIEEMKKKHTLPVAELTAGLLAVHAVMTEVNGNNTDQLLEALDMLEQFQATLTHTKLKRNLQYFITAVALLIVSAVIVLAAIHFPPALLFPIIMHAIHTTAIPSISHAIPAFTVGNILLNTLIGVGIGIAKPPVWKYSKIAYGEWQYDRAVKALEKTIAEKSNPQTESELASHAQNLLNEIQHVKNIGNKSKSIYKLTECLEAVNAVLKNPTNIHNLEHIANLAENYSPVATRLNHAYNLLLSSLAPLATFTIILAVPMALIQTAGYVAHALASRLLSFVVPFSGMGLGPDSTLGLLFVNNGISAAGEKAVGASMEDKKGVSCANIIRAWLGYEKKPELTLAKPPTMKAAIKSLKKGLKTSRVKSELMRDKIIDFKVQFNTVANDSGNPIIPSRNK